MQGGYIQTCGAGGEVKATAMEKGGVYEEVGRSIGENCDKKLRGLRGADLLRFGFMLPTCPEGAQIWK